MTAEELGPDGQWFLSSPYFLSFKIRSIVKCIFDVITAFQGENTFISLIVYIKF